MSIQQEVYAAVKARGYVDGWTAEKFAARQVCKLQEELAELAGEVNGMSSDAYRAIYRAGKEARADFDAVYLWRFAPNSEYTYTDNAAAELADLVVVALCMAEALGVDVLTAALHKARADVGRGTRTAPSDAGILGA